MSPLARGGALALLAACAFGVTAPLVRRFGHDVGPFATAALLYFGAAATASRSTSPHPPAPSPQGEGEKTPRGEGEKTPLFPRLLFVALAGAFVAPVCFAWGVQRTSATASSLLLNAEGPLTVALAFLVYREAIGARVAWAAAAIALGGAVLVVGQGGGGETSAVGALAVVAATLAWAVDNTLTRPLAQLEASRVVLAKGALGAGLSALVALALGEKVPAIGTALALAVCGATGYGASLRLYLAAQRTLGAARTASIFAAAPFVGAVVAILLGDRPPFGPTMLAAALCGLGVALHLTEHHAHPHSHAPVAHAHVHRHDDGHHDHVHQPPFTGEHSHPHTHAAVTHEHEHAPDVHHDHTHG